MKILAVDNELIQIQMLERAIRKNLPDVSLACFCNPLQALEWAEENKPEIAFLDMQMPVMDGVMLGKSLKKINPHINLIFVTGYYEDYVEQAVPLRFSGYLQKPITANAVKTELENLRFPILPIQNNIFAHAEEKINVRCFGKFEIFFGGVPVRFARTKTKELFAYLIDCRGISVSGNEICTTVFADIPQESSRKSALRNCVADLRNTLDLISMQSVFIKGFNSYALDVNKVNCDYYRWLKNDPEAVRSFCGEYMTQYHWAKETLADFFQLKKEEKNEKKELHKKVK